MLKNSEISSGFGDPHLSEAHKFLITQRFLQLLLGEQKYQKRIVEPVKRMVKEEIWEQELKDAQNHLVHQE